MDDAKKLAELAPKIMNVFHDLGRQHPADERLSMRQFQALIILNANEKLTLTQLCDKLSLARSTGTELVNRMIDLGLLQKQSEKKDQRSVTLTVSAKGADLLSQRQQMLTEMFMKFLSPFTASDRQTFVRCFEKIWELSVQYHTRLTAAE